MQPTEQSLHYRITERAAERGLLSTRQVWEAAIAFSKNRGASPEEILPLTKAQIDTLFPESIEITASQIFIEEEEFDSLDERKTSHQIPLPPKQEVKPIRKKGLEDPFPSLRAERPNFDKAPEIQSAEWGLEVDDVKMWSVETPNKGMKPVVVGEVEEEETSPRAIGKRINKESGPRYVLGEELGRGGIGRVVAALDRLSGRTVALKLLQDGRNDAVHTRRFLTEAQVTAQLEHPSVIPIYDMGELEGGVPYYAMRVVSRFSLREILRDSKIRAQWPVNKLCNVLLQVSRALSYAHSRGVLHRDIKPANILIGEYGEVYIADWGICKLMEESELVSSDDGPATVIGIVLGTPGYMSPEQIRGEPLDARSDLFALGAILYQIITGQKPFRGKEADQLLEATLFEAPKRPRQLNPSCPLVLDELCMKLLSKRVMDRPASAEDVARELESFLEGSKEKERGSQEAERSVEHARNLLRRYHTLGEEALQLENAARRVLEPLKTYDPIEKKRPGWELEQRKSTTEALRAKVMAEVIERFSQALAHEPENREARLGLAELYYEKAREAELSRQEPQRIFYESMVLEHDDGRYTKIFSSDAWLSVYSNPQNAEVILYRYEPRDRRLLPVPEHSIGRTPTKEYKLLPGRYLLVLRLAGFREIQYPVHCQRGEHTEISVNLYTEQQLGVHNVLIPQGHFIFGGDPFADDHIARQEMFLGDYAMARFPVTLGEYLQFINEIGRYDQSQAERRIPRTEGVDGAYVKQDRRGLWVPRYEVLVSGEGRSFCPEEQIYNIPASAINWFDAAAYCRWRSQREGVQYRLPTEAEWEKAARGTDGRYFPWGDGFDPTFCKMRESRPGLNQPEPVGSFALDESPYGVRDMAGSARCWTLDVFNELSEAQALAEKEPAAGGVRDVTSVRAVRGGTWGTTEPRSRCASRHKRFSVMRTPFIGFRLVRVL